MSKKKQTRADIGFMIMFTFLFLCGMGVMIFTALQMAAHK